MNKQHKKKRKWQMPDTYVIIFFVVVFAAVMTYIIPTGRFEVVYKVYNHENQVIAQVEGAQQVAFVVNEQKFLLDATGMETLVFEEGNNQPLATMSKVNAQSYEYLKEGEINFKVLQEYGDYVSEGEIKGIKLFEEGGGVGFFNFAFEGLVSGNKWGTAVGIVAFILISGGAFGIILRTGAVEIGMMSMIKRTKSAQSLIIPTLFFLFALGGAVFGMAEETIPFAMIIVPLMIAMGYDSIVGIMVTFVATQIGFATSWMNPFSVAIAQSIAGLPILSGAGVRIGFFILFTAIGMIYTISYARKIKKVPTSSLAYETDAFYREDFRHSEEKNEKFTVGHALVLMTLTAGIGWIIWGVDKKGYYIPEIAGIFFTMGIVAGIVGCIFKLSEMRINDIAVAFRKGAEELVGAAIIVGLAQGILLVLGGQSPFENTVLNTVLNSMAQVLQYLPAAISALFMYLFQTVFNFFVVSGSGQAAITMPLMTPLAELVGVTKQVAVLTFQFGDGLTNIFVPTCGTLIAILGVAKLDWVKWARFQMKFLGILIAVASLSVMLATVMGYQ
ncbi:MAG: putative basic amino acid antiporter YfcC [Cellulosilyticaceae bacterium]